MTSIVDRLFALLWVVVGTVAFVAAGDISGGGANSQDGLGPKAFPQAIGIVLVGLGLWLLLAEPLARLISRSPDNTVATQLPEDAPAASEEEASTPAPPWRVPLAIFITLAYVVLLPIIHYVAATLLASIAMLFLLGARSIPVLFIYPVVLTFAAQYAFTEIVGVILP